MLFRSISCDGRILSKDIALLNESNYEIKSVMIDVSIITAWIRGEHISEKRKFKSIFKKS